MTGNIIKSTFNSNGGGVNYSLEEQNTGLKWIDGKDIYQKTIYFNALGGANAQVTRDISDLNISTLIKAEGLVMDPYNNYLTLPNVEIDSSQYNIYMGVTLKPDFKVVRIAVGSYGRTDNQAYVTIQYTKN